MKQSTVDKVAWTAVFMIGFIIISAAFLLGWAFIEIIQWLTSK